MKIAFTGDNHVQIHGAPGDLTRMHARASQAQVLICGGDMGEGTRPYWGGETDDYATLLGTHPDTMYVLGNHDLFNAYRLTPDKALVKNQELYPQSAACLEPTWEDVETVLLRDDHAFVGSIGFPDFLHPDLPSSRDRYADIINCKTIDPRWIGLTDWNMYTDRLNVAFNIRLDKALDYTGIRHVVLTLHYPCLPAHSLSGPQDSVWPYFYNWQVGRAILERAKAHPDTTFWVLAGHSHEYCTGIWGMEAQNVYAYGLKTDYKTQDVHVFDTSDDIGTLRELVR
jgi:hypothetical protein